MPVDVFLSKTLTGDLILDWIRRPVRTTVDNISPDVNAVCHPQVIY